MLNAYLFDEEGFTGNRDRYDDPSNSFLNEVLERRTGIPITLALVYMEVARRAGIQIEGVNFPGHFLMRFTASSSSIRSIEARGCQRTTVAGCCSGMSAMRPHSIPRCWRLQPSLRCSPACC